MLPAGAQPGSRPPAATPGLETPQEYRPVALMGEGRDNAVVMLRPLRRRQSSGSLAVIREAGEAAPVLGSRRVRRVKRRPVPFYPRWEGQGGENARTVEYGRDEAAKLRSLGRADSQKGKSAPQSKAAGVGGSWKRQYVQTCHGTKNLQCWKLAGDPRPGSVCLRALTICWSQLMIGSQNTSGKLGRHLRKDMYV